MTFRLPERTVVLAFEDGDYAGAEIRCRIDIPLRLYFEIAKLAGSENPEVIRKGLALFSEHALIDWNLTDSEGVIPASSDGFERLPLALARLVMDRWADAVPDVPGPLARQSANGVSSRGRARSRSR